MRLFRPLSTIAVALLGAIAVATPAHAVILQIDGTVCPQSVGNIQPGLNKGENGTPFTTTGTPGNVAGAGPKGAIDPVFDATESPQVFAVPKTGNNFNTVQFIDLLEGAGYENTFGWYNVGDDLSNLGNLHPVLTCAGTNYEPTPDGNSSLSVNFQTEFAAGRYKGGFVGFFLVTPEGQAGTCSTGNCGNPAEAACVGRIYYTEKEINGDGNYVHYLLYQSKITDAAGKRSNDFYFGFEDLYRGGDNDFEDMLILVKGLVVPCTPSAEICDGKDNNCDGLIDNGATDVGIDCYSGPAGTQGKGECKAGKTVCASTGPGDTTKTCVGAIVPAGEICDGKDNNCNGSVDEAPYVVALPNACPPQQGTCTAETQCLAGAPKCVVKNGATPEKCDGQDNDCNGLVDDNPTDAGGSCTPTGSEPTVGACKVGTSVCANGALTCTGYKGPTAELCDGLDNDCDGTIDDSPTDLLAKCGPSGVTICDSGAEQCINGAKICTGFTLPAPEVCNGKDDDCNGLVDDLPVDTGAPCGSNVGACQAGVIACVNGALFCQGDKKPGAEICDGIDNDCDGQIDENSPADKLPGVGDACSEVAGCTGVQACKNGQLLCIGDGGTPEICDGKDNDCNGVIDDNPTDTGSLCGNNVGSCLPGVFACIAKVDGDLTTDELVCTGGVGPKDEVCDGADNDCDGFIDEGVLPGIGVSCGGQSCGAGVVACKNGQPICETAGGTGKPELCNGLDDDCNGLIDDNPIDVDAACGSSKGECKPGVFKCVPKVDGDPTSDEKLCVGGTDPKDEICDGKDNDCDGKTDEDPDAEGPLFLPGVGEICSQVGTCGSGLVSCKDGALICVSVGQTAPEICDGIDNDCDGLIDEDTVDSGVPCGSAVGECSLGVSKCVAGKLACEGEVAGTPEVCDGKDNDCNGVTDEDPDGAGPKQLPGAGEDCAPEGLSLPLKGECKVGKTVCFGGKFTCLGAVGPRTETCNGKDEDCDGVVDSPDPCPGDAVCVAGQCSAKCTKTGEFTTCPGGLECISGYCLPPGSSGVGGTSAGGGSGGSGAGAKGGATSGGGASAAGGTTGQGANGQGANGQGGNGRGGNGQGANGQGGSATSGGGTTGQGANNGAGGARAANDSDGDGQADAWGLATGSGCSVGTPERRGIWSPFGTVLALFTAALGARRRGRSPRPDDDSSTRGASRDGHKVVR